MYVSTEGSGETMRVNRLVSGLATRRCDKYRNRMYWLIRMNRIVGERSGSVVECLTRDRRAAGSSLTGVTASCP